MSSMLMTRKLSGASLLPSAMNRSMSSASPTMDFCIDIMRSTHCLSSSMLSSGKKRRRTPLLTGRSSSFAVSFKSA